VIPPLAYERSSQAIECPEQPVTEEGDGLFLPTPRRIIHAAIRFGKSFEFVVECCVL
jgi:hypothetical protein